jgi:hypothetical protein
MKQYNLHDMIGTLKSALLSYMCSSLPVGNHESQRRLGEEFYKRWEEDAFKGPYLEAVPRYERKKSLEQIFTSPRNSSPTKQRFRDLIRPRYSLKDFENLLSRKGVSQGILELVGTDDLRRTWERSLYDHQLRSLSIVTNRKNLVVSTGTGSGKTDCFLLPLLYLILCEPEDQRQRTGVRALLLYPMNALVEDQMRRLRGLLCWINGQSQFASGDTPKLARPITFGRYVGMTRVNSADTYGERADPSPNIAGLGELLYREEMQQNPPDILITNFSMLEYMLLRNDDRRIFARPELFRLLVLDEIHSYRGTQGMEVACLLRRLDDLLRRKAGGARVSYQRVGLSATLPSDESSRKSLASFASDLFGCPVDEECVVTESVRNPAGKSTGGPWPRVVRDLIDLPAITPGLCARLGLAARGDDGPDEIPKEEWQLLAEVLQSSLEESEQGLETIERLGRVLTRSPVFAALKATVEGTSIIRAEKAGVSLFGEGVEFAQREQALGVLLQLICAGQVAEQGLLPLRVHFFVKEQREAVLCTNPAHPLGASSTDGWWRKLYLPHRTRCDDCEGLVFPVFLCRRCGFVFMEAWLRVGQGQLFPEPDGLMPAGSFTRVLFRPFGSVSEYLQNKLKTDTPESVEVNKRTLCLNCGTRIMDGPAGDAAAAAHACGGSALLPILELSSPGVDVRITTCPHCNQNYYGGDQEVVTPPILSPYGATTVLLEEMKRVLDAPLKHHITKVLCFSDSRQQAAKIARRLGRTNQDTVFRQLLYRALLGSDGRGLTARQIVDAIADFLQRDVSLAESFCERGESVRDEGLLRRRVATLLFREFCAEFQTLERLGLARIEYPPELSEAGAEAVATHWLGQKLNSVEREALFHSFIDWQFRLNRWAVTTSTLRIDYTDLPYAYSDKSVAMYGTDGGPLGFLMRRNNSRSRRLNLYLRLCKKWQHLLESVADVEGFNKLAGAIWEQALTKRDFLTSQAEHGGPDPRKAFMATGPANAEQLQLKLNFEAFRWALTGPETPIFRCSACGYVSTFDIHHVCSVRDCAGELVGTTLKDVAAEKFSPMSHYIRLLTERPPKPLRVEEHTAQLSPKRRAQIEKEFRNDEVGGLDVISGSTTFELGVDLGEVNSVVLANLPPEISNYRQRAGRAGRRLGMLPFILGYVRERPHDRYFWSRLEDFIAGPLRVPWLANPSREIVLRHANAIIMARALESHGSSHQLQGPPCGEFVDFCLGATQRAWVVAESERGELRQSLHALLSVNPSLSLGPRACADHFLHSLEMHQTRNFPGRARDPSIEVFSDYGVLPSYSFPIYVDELVLYGQPASEPPRVNLKLTRDRRIALREYFPGRLIEADKWVLESVGVGEGFDRKSMSVCQNCRKVREGNGSGPCPSCEGRCTQINAIIPWGGFLGRVPPETPSVDRDAFGLQVSEVIFDPASDPEPELRGIGHFLQVATQSAAQMTNARMRMFSPRPANASGLMLVESQEKDVGRQGREFMRCLMLPERAKNRVGAASPFNLMHEFTTDILRVRFDGRCAASLLSPAEFAKLRASGNREEAEKARTIFLYTMGQAIATAASRCLQISPAELDFTLRFVPENAVLNCEIILFDTAPGGAGYASRCGESGELRRILEEAVNVLSCSGCTDSCYDCLRTYDNQWMHARLNRNFVLDGLKQFLQANW